MLIDELIADGAPGYDASIACIMPSLRKAQKFVLSPEYAAVADELAQDYTGLVKAFEHCRLPYAHTWIEVVQAERPLFSAAAIQAPGFQVTPRRVGFLLVATDEDLSTWKTHLFWSTDVSCSCAALAMEFDMRGRFINDRLPTEEQMDRLQRTSSVLKVADKHPGWDHASDAVKQAMLTHTRPVAPDYLLPSAAGIPSHKVKDYYQIIIDLARSDWAGEPGFLLAVIGLLNARNVVEMQHVDNAKLNRAREKRGRAPLFEHKVLKIAQRHRRHMNGDASRDHYAPMRGHFVRGHFKTRRSGIFFWHPHARGSFQRGTIEKEYRL